MTPQSSLLARILNHKRAELAALQRTTPLATLQPHAKAAPAPRNFAAALRHKTTVALIAEVKKASPSRGVLLEHFDHRHLAQTYLSNGAAALSILTDIPFFQGSMAYLHDIRQDQEKMGNTAPLLRKDFLLEPYHVYEARAYGADAVLLIVAALSDTELRGLLDVTHSLGMHALVEVHTADEMERALAADAPIIGVNNRDLHTFTTSLETTEQLATMLPTGPHRPVLVSESGIFTPADVARLHTCGVDAVLVGEALVTASDIGAQVRELSGA